MDNYELNLKSQQMRNLSAEGKFKQAALIADEIDWGRVKNNRVLILAADIYEATGQLEKEYDVLTFAYDRTPLGKQLAYRLALVAASLKEFDDAEAYYQDFISMAPSDPMRYLLRYRISRIKGEDIDVLIGLLDRYLDGDMDEKWSYELCRLYHQAGYVDKCVELCDELITWFGDGEYVLKALELKQLHTPLTRAQQEKYTHLREHADEVEKEQEFGAEIRRAKYEVERNKTLSEKMADAVERRALGEQSAPDEQKNPEKKAPEKKAPEKKAPEKKEAEQRASMNSEPDENAGEEDDPGDGVSMNFDVDDIQIKTYSDQAYDTMNIQEELAKSMENLLQTEIQPSPSEIPGVKTFVPPDDTQDEDTATEAASGDEPEKQITGQMSIEDILKDLQTRGILKGETVDDVLKVTGNLPKVEVPAPASGQKSRNHGSDDSHRAMEEKVVKEYEAVSLRDFVTGEIDLELVKNEVSEMFSEDQSANQKIEDATLSEKFLADQAGQEKEDEDTLIFLENEGSDAEEARIHAPAEELTPGVTDHEREEAAASEEPVAEETVPEEISASEEAAAEERAGAGQASAAAPAETEAAPEEICASEEAAPAEEEPAKKETVPEEISASEEAAAEERAGAGQAEAAASAEEETVPEKISASEEAAPAEEEPAEEEKAGAEKAEAEKDLSRLGQDENVYTQMKQEEIKRETERMEDVFAIIQEMESGMSEDDRIYNAYTDEETEEHYELDEEDKADFAQYLRITGMENQIAKAIQDYVSDYSNDGSSKRNNILITGEVKSGKSNLALCMIRSLNRHLGRKGRKTARITGFNLNRKTLSVSMPRLIGNDLLIEHAGEINKDIVFEMMDILPKYTGGMIVVMEDEKARLDHLFEEYPLLQEFFPHRLDIKEYDINEWVAVAKSYAKSQGYTVDELGTLALYAEIDALYSILQGLEVDDIRDVVDDAIEHAEQKMFSRAFRRLFGKKEEHGLKVLRETDFTD